MEAASPELCIAMKLVRPVLRLGNKDSMAEVIASELNRTGCPRTLESIRNAIGEAQKAERKFSEALSSIGEAFLNKLEKTGEKGYVGLGRDYVVLDPEASSRTGAMFSSVRRMRYLPQAFLREHYSGVDIDSLVENEYWAQSADILKACLFVARHPLLYPIRQMNFACGPDSIKWFMEEDIFKRAGKPLLHLMTDAQTNNAPFVTRAEAHERVVNQTPPGPLLPLESFSYRKKRPLTHNGERLWLAPFMGEASRLGAAAGRFRGIDARVAPTATPEAREMADRFISTETCFPLSGVIGDISAHLATMERERGAAFVNDRCLVFMPTTSGPCRFGKYAEIMGLLLDRLGFGGVPVISPTTANGYLDTDALDIPVTFLKKASLLGDVYNAVYASGVLDDLTLRFRPYSDEKTFDEAYARQLRSIENILETRGASFRNIAPWISETAECFRNLSRETERFPLVLYSGEIYMRHHDPYTGWVIRALERQGLELIRNPVAEWLRYVNCVGGKESSLPGYMAARAYMDRVDRKAARALGGMVADRRV
ncbi:MAG: acyl-CoA dehydratase activase-related protein, partial [Synergistota bacterium]|nr:acyl-CoA dehydratase activase-related protein [Synergistota bacterium]